MLLYIYIDKEGSGISFGINKDKDNDKSAEKTQHVLYIFEKDLTEGYQI